MTTWRRFSLHLLAAILGFSGLMFVALALADPWGAILPFPILPHTPADRSQRWAYPEMARDPRFDAAIIGNSSGRLLDPAILDPAVGAAFINLAMVRAYPYEQSRLLEVYLQAHPAPRALLIGIDRSWCESGGDLMRFGYDPIPEWLYDHDRLAALANLFNLHAIVTAWQSLRRGLGVAPHVYAENGFTLIEVDAHPYDPVLAHRLISENLAEGWPKAVGDPAGWRYQGLEILAAQLATLPPTTRALLVLVPRFALYPRPGSDGAAMIEECRRRVVALARRRPDTEVYDMAFANAMTSDESRWWDAVHARPDTMHEATLALAAAIEGRPSPLVRTLVPHAPASASAP